MALTLVGLAVLPLSGEVFYIRVFTRIMIYAIAACSLDLILGYGGMVSLGHAAFVGVGAYTVAILGAYGVTSAWLVWPASILLAALCALVIGSISLRTRGVSFIMITLAFAQMLYYLAVSLQTYGGDDGLRITRNTFHGLLDVRQPMTLYYVTFACLCGLLWLGRRLIHAQLGMVWRGIRENERRMQALGYATFAYKLLGFVSAGAVAGLAGALVANHTAYVSPALMHWTRSGEIMVMVILGGMGSGFGPVLGAIALLLTEEILASYTEHWMIILGPLLLGVVLWARHGLYGLLQPRGTRL
ncbi:MAG: branched-chain amino acid ABC transporter permease [Candidatus Tectomicrobia bacterium]|uniref:Branched-chain amino acid ABC transporter permease n=1 Tax=Tectimicrobiota bacterium TaxID=2528274 RepID=A0A937W5P4_UNCTE|nr:branched-chain amino acid ABC transporter permease [Candidatus Tectomicrobia bacterium]